MALFPVYWGVFSFIRPSPPPGWEPPDASDRAPAVPRKHLLKVLEFWRWKPLGKKNQTDRYLFSRAKKPGTTPLASGIKDRLAPASSGLQAWPPPTSIAAIIRWIRESLGALGRRKIICLKASTSLAFKKIFFYFKPSHNSNVSLIIFCRGKKLITRRNIKH